MIRTESHMWWAIALATLIMFVGTLQAVPTALAWCAAGGFLLVTSINSEPPAYGNLMRTIAVLFLLVGAAEIYIAVTGS